MENRRTTQKISVEPIKHVFNLLVIKPCKTTKRLFMTNITRRFNRNIENIEILSKILRVNFSYFLFV